MVLFTERERREWGRRERLGGRDIRSKRGRNRKGERGRVGKTVWLTERLKVEMKQYYHSFYIASEAPTVTTKRSGYFF